MAQTALTDKKLQALISALLTNEKVSDPTFTPTFANSLNLLDKIGKDVTWEQNHIDRLGELQGERLENGKTIEEYKWDLVTPQDVDPTTPEKVLANWTPSARIPYFSYTIGEKIIPVSRKYNDINRAFTDMGETAKALSGIAKSSEDSATKYRYGLKKHLLGKVYDLVNASRTDSVVFAKATAYAKGTYVKDAATATSYGIIFNVYAANAASSYADAVAKGYIVELNSLVEVLAKPTDETSGENFIEALKKIIEISQDDSQGNSLSGNTLGVQGSLMIYVKNGIMPNLEVKTLAGAFQLDKLSIPVSIKHLPDFGDADDSVYCIIVDTRGVRLHESCNYTLDNTNGYEGWVSWFRHLEYTPYISRNTFVHIFKAN